MATRRKIKRFVVDVNCYVSIFINGETDWLLHYIIRNRIEIFIDGILLAELGKVLEYPKIKKVLPLSPTLYLNFVRVIGTQIKSGSFNTQSPDKEDNYLFDLALSSNAKALVTGEKALLHWQATPVEVISLSAFKDLF